MCETDRETALWRFWAARAAAQLHDPSQARQLYESLLSDDNYYSGMAAARLHRAVVPRLQTLPLEQELLASIERVPTMDRARELFLCGMRQEALAEWQLGNKEQARAALATGEELEPREMPPSVAEDPGTAWLVWLFSRIQLDEAEALIKPTSSASSQADVLVAKAEVNRLAEASDEAAASLRGALRIYEDRRATQLATQARAALASLAFPIGRGPA